MFVCATVLVLYVLCLAKKKEKKKRKEVIAHQCSFYCKQLF